MIVAVIPAYNEENTVAAVVAGARAHVDAVILVNDGSSDRTAMRGAQSGARVVTHDTNRGPGAATMTGIRLARRLGATTVVTIDADGQHDPADIPALLAPIRAGQADAVFANRFGQPNTIPATRRILNWCGNVVTLVAARSWVADSQCGFKAFGPTAIQQLDITAPGFEFCSQIVREAIHYHWRIRQVPVRVRYSAQTLAKGQSFVRGLGTALRILAQGGRRRMDLPVREPAG